MTDVRALLDDLGGAGSTATTVTLPSLSVEEGERLRSQAAHHKLSRAVAVALEEASGDERTKALAAALHRDASPTPRAERGLASEIARIDAAARARRVSAFAIKGLAARQWYERPAIRHLGDLDLLVGSRAEAQAVAAELEAPGTSRTDYDEDDVISIGAGAGWSFDIDIHYGVERHLLRADLMPPPSGPGTRFPPSEVALLSILASVGEADEALLKDANDAFLLSGGIEIVATLERVAGGDRTLRHGARLIGGALHR
jgi:hypothetical protein